MSPVHRFRWWSEMSQACRVGLLIGLALTAVLCAGVGFSLQVNSEDRSDRILRSGDGQAQIRELENWDSLSEPFWFYQREVGWSLKLGTDADEVIDYLAERGLLAGDGDWRDGLVYSVMEVGSDHSLQVLRDHEITVCDSPFVQNSWPDAGISAETATLGSPADSGEFGGLAISTAISADERRTLNDDIDRCTDTTPDLPSSSQPEPSPSLDRCYWEQLGILCPSPPTDGQS